MRIRDACSDDAAGIVAVLNPIIDAGCYTALDTPVTIEAERRYISAVPARGIFHVAEQGGAILGFQTVEPFVTYTHAFDHVGVIATFVDLARRRQGIGARLFEATLAAATRQGYEKFFTYVRADNPAALRAYEKHGFHTIGTAQRHAKFGDRYVDEILIEKFL
jgi:L-amino acid N-acyltransferase YncA